MKLEFRPRPGFTWRSVGLTVPGWTTRSSRVAAWVAAVEAVRGNAAAQPDPPCQGENGTVSVHLKRLSIAQPVRHHVCDAGFPRASTFCRPIPGALFSGNRHVSLAIKPKIPCFAVEPYSARHLAHLVSLGLFRSQ